MKILLKYLPMGLLAVVAAGSLAGNFVLYRQLHAFKENPQYKSEMENAQVVERVRRLMVIPDEAPTIATVTDPGKLQDQAFFEHAKKGDKVLIFSTAKKAILYDPVADKILEVGPLNVTAEAAPAAEDEKAAAKTTSKKTAPSKDEDQ